MKIDDFAARSLCAVQDIAVNDDQITVIVRQATIGNMD
jgi:hypothetical protein